VPLCCDNYFFHEGLDVGQMSLTEKGRSQHGH
jgi:hypothetical protein